MQRQIQKRSLPVAKTSCVKVYKTSLFSSTGDSITHLLTSFYCHCATLNFYFCQYYQVLQVPNKRLSHLLVFHRPPSKNICENSLQKREFPQFQTFWSFICLICMNLSLRAKIRKTLLTYREIYSFLMEYNEIKIHKKQPILELQVEVAQIWQSD